MPTPEDSSSSNAEEPRVLLTKPQTIPPSPPLTPMSEAHTVETATRGTEIGSASVPRPARVGVEVVQVAPAELRAVAHRDARKGSELLACVLRHHPDRATISGSLSLTLIVGPTARTASTKLDACKFTEVEICTCIRDKLARMRFSPDLINAELQLRVRAFPPG
jgi:hypothetical protein